MLTEQLPSAQAEELIYKIPSCPFPIPPQNKLIFLHSITMLSLILVWALRNCSISEHRSNSTSKSLIRSTSASLELCGVPHLGLSRLPGHIQIIWQHVFTQKKPVPTQNSIASTIAGQLPALCLLGRQISCAQTCSTELLYTILLLLQLHTAVTFSALLRSTERGQNKDFPRKLSNITEQLYPSPSVSAWGKTYCFLQRVPDVSVCGRLGLTLWFY